MSLLLDIYRSLPPLLQNWAASLHGHRLMRERYAGETDRLVSEAVARESWTAEQWAAYREQSLSELLQRARNDVAYYREQWADRSGGLDGRRLADWPVLEKDALRGSAKRFLADDVSADIGNLIRVNTSGTTGKPIVLYRTRAASVAWYALVEARMRLWYGISRHDRWAIFGGRLVVPFARRKPPFWVWNSGMRQLYCSAYHLSPYMVEHYATALERYRIDYLLGYTSALFCLAQALVAAGRKIGPFRVVLTNAEPLYEHQRKLMEEAFGCPIRETYGMAETVAAAGECEAGKMHLWPEVGELEVEDDDGNISTTGTGALLATGLINREMPLIRYRIGDRVTLVDSESKCSCGRTLPLLGKVEGRMDDLIQTPDGRRIGRLDPVFKGDLDIEEAQIAQLSRELLEVRYVCRSSGTAGIEQQIESELRARVGDMKIQFVRMDSIPRGANGKFRAVVSEMDG